jgi:hypothetical protein
MARFCKELKIGGLEYLCYYVTDKVFKPSRGRLKGAFGHDIEFTLQIRNLLNAITLRIKNLLNAIYIRYLTDMDGFTVSVISHLLVICSIGIDYSLFSPWQASGWSSVYLNKFST